MILRFSQITSFISSFYSFISEMLQGDKLSLGWFWDPSPDLGWELRQTYQYTRVGIHRIKYNAKIFLDGKVHPLFHGCWLRGKGVCVLFLLMKMSSLGKNAPLYSPSHPGNLLANSSTDRMSVCVLSWGSQCDVWIVSLPSFCKQARVKRPRERIGGGPLWRIVGLCLWPYEAFQLLAVVML